MKVQIGIQVLLIEDIDERGPTLGNVAMAKEFPDHGPILTFNEGVIVGLAGTGLGELDQEFTEQVSHARKRRGHRVAPDRPP